MRFLYSFIRRAKDKFLIPLRHRPCNCVNFPLPSELRQSVEEPLFRTWFIDIDTDLNIPHQIPDFGMVSELSGEMALHSLQIAVTNIQQSLKRGHQAALITAPLNKKAISLKTPDFIGHTEFLAATTQSEATMSFISPAFHLILITTHLPLRQVSAAMTPAAIHKALRHALFLQKQMDDTLPLAVMGLNPHAGEEGLLGKEEDVLREAIQLFVDQGERIEGPLSADSTFFGLVSRKKRYRTVVACYHDQGLIPLKMMSQSQSVNLTLGLPFIRTSVDHGTAFDIAGTYTS